MGKVNGGLFTTNTAEWSTPQEFFDMLDAEFGFTLDVCATAENAKCQRFYAIEDDGLAKPWEGVCWMNPPYGRQIARWVERAYEASLDGATVVCLIPARSDTAYWHNYVMKAKEVRFVRGRLHFGGGHELTAHNAPFPCAVVVFGEHARRWPLMSSMERR